MILRDATRFFSSLPQIPFFRERFHANWYFSSKMAQTLDKIITEIKLNKEIIEKIL